MASGPLVSIFWNAEAFWVTQRTIFEFSAPEILIATELAFGHDSQSGDAEFFRLPLSRDDGVRVWATKLSRETKTANAVVKPRQTVLR